jgi:DeoR/GlpR family transcriptional regulator of sugar metabolism
VAQTARSDLRGLEEQGFLDRISAGRGFAWTPADDLERRLKADRVNPGSLTLP